MASLLQCKDCHMNFQSQQQLSKHKLKFCVRSTRNLDDSQLRRRLHSESPHRVRTPDERLHQLQKLKEQRSRSRDLQDFEERMILDQIKDDEHQGSSPTKPTKNRLPLSKYKDVRDLQMESKIRWSNCYGGNPGFMYLNHIARYLNTDKTVRFVAEEIANHAKEKQYEKLREKENSRINQLAPKLPGGSGHNSPISRNSDSSMSIYLDDEYRRNSVQGLQLRNLAENHGRQMEFLQSRNKNLEKQREDIRKQLENIGRRTAVPQNDNVADVLRELKEQELRNQKSLDDLKRQLQELSIKKKKSLEVEKPANQQSPSPQETRRNLAIPVHLGKSLVAEISAIRQAYLQNGGSDSGVLTQMSQLQTEAQSIEDQMNQKPDRRSPREKPKDIQATLRMLEMENDRLNLELHLLQEQNILAQNHKRSDRDDDLERELRRLQREHLDKMYGLQKELEELRLLIMTERNRPNVTSPFVHHATPAPLLREKTPWLLQKPYGELDLNAPYDQYAGFMIFYDFLLSMDPTIEVCRLIVSLHSSTAMMAEPTILPTVYTERATQERFNYIYSNAVIRANQPVPKCPPDHDLGIVIELQASGGPATEHDRHSLTTRAWTKIPLFDNTGRLIAGLYRIPIRTVPIKPFMHVSQIQRMPKYGNAELYYRIVNMRDAEIYNKQQMSAANYSQYMYPQWFVEAREVIPIPSRQNVPPPHTASPLPIHRRPKSNEHLPVIQHRATHSPKTLAPHELTLGFQVDRVKNAELGEGKIRLTAFYASTGKVVQSSTSPVTCSTTAVRSNFKYGYHVFGQQEAVFQEVKFQGDMVLIASFYFKKYPSDLANDFLLQEEDDQDNSLFDDKTLLAWAALPLVNCDENIPLKKRIAFNPSTMTINQGTHTLPLFLPPIPEPSQIPIDTIFYNTDFQRYGKATLRVYVFQDHPRPGSLTPSEDSDTDDEKNLPELAWLPLERKSPPKNPFLLGDGFDVYIDGCRFLPDSVTFTKVAGRILDREYVLFGKDINTSIKLDCDVYNPVYEEKTEFRETNIPPTATLLLKVYTMDNFYKKLTAVGFATLNIFVEIESERQPVVNQPMQVSLNEGAHQIRLYSQGPNGVDPFSESCLRDAGFRIIPCASLLVRLVKVSRTAGGKALESSKVPQADWLRMGLFQPRPNYTDRVYYSSKCQPTKGETRLYHSMLKRTRRPVREIVIQMAAPKESFLKNDKAIEDYIKSQLTKPADLKPLEQDLNFICQYSPKHGIKIAIDNAVNLPWSNFTHAHMCLNPPAAFYLGAPYATYDKLIFTEILDTKSTNTSPSWKDGFKHFPRRSYHQFLTVIIHLQEISISASKENFKYGLLEQAWSAIQIFYNKYCATQTYQLPLLAGSPSQTILKQLAREPCKEWMERNIRNGTIHLLEGSSLFVRVADARRDDELVSEASSNNKQVEVNTDYIPVGMEETYSRERPGKILESLIPVGKSPEQFVDNLKVKFKSLVYKLYEEGQINK